MCFNTTGREEITVEKRGLLEGGHKEKLPLTKPGKFLGCLKIVHHPLLGIPVLAESRWRGVALWKSQEDRIKEEGEF